MVVIGVSNEQSSDAVSWLPLFLSNDTTGFRQLIGDPGTCKRAELNVPFRKTLPKTESGQLLLVSIEDDVL